MRQDGVDRLVAGVEEMLYVDARLRRPEPKPLVRLVPDQPVANPGIAAGCGGRESAEVTSVGWRVGRWPAAVRPGRRPDHREHGGQIMAAEAAEDPVGPVPVVGGIPRR